MLNTCRLMRSLSTAVLVALQGAVPKSAPAADIGAVASGNWSSPATWTSGVPGIDDNVFIGSIYPTGAAANAAVTLSQNSLASFVYLGDGAGTSGTLDLGGYTLTANSLSLGYAGGTGAILRTGGGALSLNATAFTGISLSSGAFSFDPGDAAAQLFVSAGSAAMTAAPGNVTNRLMVYAGGTLTLGADLAVTTYYPGASPAPLAEIDGTINANGHTISATFLNLGNIGGPFTILNRGPINVGELVATAFPGSTQAVFNLTTTDTVNDLYAEGVSTTLPANIRLRTLAMNSNGATPPTYPTTTTSAGNVIGSVLVAPGCTLTLGANLTVTSGLELGGILNANSHAMSVPSIHFGYLAGPAILQNDGLVIAGAWNQDNATRVQLNQPGDALGALLLTANSALTIGGAAGQSSGLTLTGQPASNLSITAGSDLILDVNGLASGWVFRWANPTGSDHIGDLQTLINAGEITFAYSNGGSYTITSDGFYTYVNVIPVPEPSTLLMSVTAAGMLAGVRRWRTRSYC